MTLGHFSGYTELFRNCILMFTGESQTLTGFPVIPPGITVTPAGSWTTASLGNNRNVLVFNGTTSAIFLTDSDSWAIFESDFTICGWIKFSSLAANQTFLRQYGDASNSWYFRWGTSNTIQLYGLVSGSATFNYTCSFTPVADTWYHIVIQRSGSSCLMFVDTVSKTVTAATAFTGTTNIPGELVVGTLGGVYYAGNMKSWNIFTRALSLAEIKALMALTHPTTGIPVYPLIPAGRFIE